MEPFARVQTSDGGYTIAGSDSSGAYLVKIDASGNKWNKTIGTNVNSNPEYFGYSIVQTSDAGYAIAGSNMSYATGITDVYLVKTDAFGNASLVLVSSQANTLTLILGVSIIGPNIIYWNYIRLSKRKTQ